MSAAVVLTEYGKPPSRAYLAVLGALAEVENGYTAQLARQASVERARCTKLLHRMAQQGIAYRWHEEGDASELKRGLRVYYALTPVGRELAEQITAGVAR